MRGKGFLTRGVARGGSSVLLRGVLGLRFFFIGIWLFILLSGAILNSIEEGDPSIFFKEIGGKLFLATTNLNDELVDILERGSIIEPTNSILTNIWKHIKVFGSLYFNLFTLYLWIRTFKWIFEHTFLHGDTSRPFTNWVLSLLITFLFQIIFVLSFGDGKFIVVFEVWKNLYLVSLKFFKMVPGI